MFYWRNFIPVQIPARDKLGSSQFYRRNYTVIWTCITCGCAFFVFVLFLSSSELKHPTSKPMQISLSHWMVSEFTKFTITKKKKINKYGVLLNFHEWLKTKQWINSLLSSFKIFSMKTVIFLSIYNRLESHVWFVIYLFVILLLLSSQFAREISMNNDGGGIYINCRTSFVFFLNKRKKNSCTKNPRRNKGNLFEYYSNLIHDFLRKIIHLNTVLSENSDYFVTVIKILGNAENRLGYYKSHKAKYKFIRKTIMRLANIFIQ